MSNFVLKFELIFVLKLGLILCWNCWNLSQEAVNSLLRTAPEAVYPYGRPKRLSVPYCGRPKRLSIPAHSWPHMLSIPAFWCPQMLSMPACWLPQKLYILVLMLAHPLKFNRPKTLIRNSHLQYEFDGITVLICVFLDFLALTLVVINLATLEIILFVLIFNMNLNFQSYKFLWISLHYNDPLVKLEIDTPTLSFALGCNSKWGQSPGASCNSCLFTRGLLSS